MSIFDFNLIESIFGGGSVSPEKEQQLFAELMFMVLSRATAADANIETVEVEAVCKILKEQLGQDCTPEDIRVATLTKLYEHAPFDKYVAKMGKSLSLAYRLRILDATSEIFKSDGTVGALEADFFNLVANGLDLTPAQVRGLQQ